MICCLASAACPLRDTAAPLAACGGREGIRAVYDAGIDLGHYGEVDQLAPAGAMAEFTAYVRRQSEEEAEAAFAPLRQAARSRGHKSARSTGVNSSSSPPSASKASSFWLRDSSRRPSW